MGSMRPEGPEPAQQTHSRQAVAVPSVHLTTTTLERHMLFDAPATGSNAVFHWTVLKALFARQDVDAELARMVAGAASQPTTV